MKGIMLFVVLHLIPMGSHLNQSCKPWLWPSISRKNCAGGRCMASNDSESGARCLCFGRCSSSGKKLAGAIKSGPASVEDALSSYGSDRWLLIFPLTVRANLVGSLLQWEDPVVCFETMSSSATS
ncbi:hypothetical protein ACFX12_031986 [Malus domestica]